MHGDIPDEINFKKPGAPGLKYREIYFKILLFENIQYTLIIKTFFRYLLYSHLLFFIQINQVSLTEFVKKGCLAKSVIWICSRIQKSLACPS